MSQQPTTTAAGSIVPSRTRLALCAVLLAACGGGEQVTTPTTPVLSMEAEMWVFRYSPGMPEHPVPAVGGGWQFDFPAQDGVHYLTTPLTMDLRGRSFRVTTQILGSDPVFTWPADSCEGSPARARIMVQRQGDNLRAASGRWWYSVPIELGIGGSIIAGPFLPEQWSNVDGMVGTADVAGFDDAMAHPGSIGLTFGGGCFFGHGAWLASGTARMIVKEVKIL